MAIRTDLALASGNITTPLIRNTGRVAGGLFSTLGSWRDDDVLRYVAQLNPVLGGAKQQASRATVAFYENIAKLTGQPFNRPVIAASDLATKTLRNNITSETLFRRPFVDMRRALSSGTSMTTAIETGARRANQLAQTEVQLAKRQVGYRVRQANQNIVGYIRTLTGSENCALCYVASTQRYRKGDLLPIHPGCDCGEMPLYGTDDPGQVINQQRLDATHEAVEARFGRFDRSARDIDYRNIMVENHGEMGPVLTWKKHNTAKLADLGGPINPAAGIAEEVIDLELPPSDVGEVFSVVEQTEYTTLMRRLEQDELRALNSYTGNGYIPMNTYLRDNRRLGADMNPSVATRVEATEKAFEQSRLKADTTLYRNVDPNAFGITDVTGANVRVLTRAEVAERMKLLEGQSIVEPAFMSTSSVPGRVATGRQIKVQINAPEGTPALDMEGIDAVHGTEVAFKGEAEVLLPPGTRLRIDKVTTDNRNDVFVEATVVREGQ